MFTVRGKIAFLLSVSWLASLPMSSYEQTPAYESERSQMVREQIYGRGVKDTAVLRAFRKAPRHLFVPESYRDRAYNDNPLPIGEGQTISQPFMVAYMVEAAELRPDARVLEIGTGSGYQAAILAEIADSVFTVEIVESLGKRAQTVLHNLGYDNVAVRIGDGYYGWAEKAPFDAILVTAAIDEVPPPLIEQLAEGGRIIIPLGSSPEYQQLQLLTKEKGELKRRKLLPVRFVPFKHDQE